MHREHGGPDAMGIPRYDFSTNSNACGPCPSVLRAVQQADVTRYPDPTYRSLRERLAGLHRVAADRITLAASASEFIFRITAWAASQGIQNVRVPRHCYGDYRHAARAWALAICDESSPEMIRATRQPCLSWACDPASPLGSAQADLQLWAADCAQGRAIGVLDRAYEALRLEGRSSLDTQALDSVWQLFSPNKALGLTGVRAAYAIAPAHRPGDARALEALSPSWPLGAQGVALLQTWCEQSTQAWLADARETLRIWKLDQGRLCTELGWNLLPSQANFFCAEPNCIGDDLPSMLVHLRTQGIKLRDTASFGLARHLRLAVLPTEAQGALRRAWHEGLLIIQTARRLSE